MSDSNPPESNNGHTSASGGKPDDRTWDRLQLLFHHLESAAREERERILGDESIERDLRERVSALLRASDELATPNDKVSQSIAVIDGVEAANPQKTPARTIGPYTVVSSLGSGGTGVVYLVTRDVAGVQQRSALKVLLPQSSLPSFFDRFEKEQRILASLEHPNITRLLDAGFDENEQPYLVMEYVAGQHFDVFCDSRKLSIEERLQLFIRVCDAVDYAHRNLIVHLDLKPSNILVTDDGSPKLLDFGTSKLVQSNGLFTTTLQATPSYASPEQLRNEAVTTACDVYSLGVILFELLTGQRPFSSFSVAALIERAVTGKGAPKLDEECSPKAADDRATTPRRLHAVLTGDLKTVVHKCLEGNPLDRYASVLSLRDDLIRYIEGRPILARPQTAFYQFKKFVLRNRSKVAIAAGVLAALGISLGMAWRSQQQALLEGQRAVRMQTFLYRLLKTANSNYTGKRVSTVAEFLALGIKMLPEYIKQPNDLHAAQLALAESIYWNSDYSSAQHDFEQIAKAARSTGDFDVEAQATAYLADIAYSLGRHSEALANSAEALAVSRRPGVSASAHALCARSYALVRMESGQHTEETRKLLEYSVEEATRNGLPPHDVSQYRYYLATELADEGRLDQAEEQLSLATRLNEGDPLSMCDNALVVYGFGQLRLKQNRNPEAADIFKKAHDQFRTCYGASDPDTIYAQEYWSLALLFAGNAAGSIGPLTGSLNAIAALVPPGSRKLFEPLAGIAMADLQLKRLTEADQMSLKALASVVGKVSGIDGRLGRANLVRAHVLLAEGKYRDALPYAETAVRILALGVETPETRRDVGDANQVLAQVRAGTASH